ncbi:hypothetical protein ATKI12_8154 [Kitasatospora sp. Ki12]|uniref:FcoT family thioesterase n=1 Tax=Kitasatospora xanthocidica TaxID=83382 RepID=UPI0016782542|nr:FcoT family thioesterase [Kitasatospora xanthocidica]GHF89280.1 hypothetical protein GCM10018790_78260 [Kitasatospora xanthocidica]
MHTTSPTEPDVVQYPDDPELLHRVLTPYRAKNCEYLKSAVILREGRTPETAKLTARCTFEIPESCYIDDTGHFNSVEFNICYNQMAYYLTAKAVKDKLVEPLSRWDMADFWDRQLGNILITDFRSAFRTEMRGRHFRGEMEIIDIAEWEGTDLREPLLVMRTKCRYWDEFDGDSFGEVTVAITNPPAPAAPAAGQ